MGYAPRQNERNLKQYVDGLEDVALYPSQRAVLPSSSEQTDSAPYPVYTVATATTATGTTGVASSTTGSTTATTIDSCVIFGGQNDYHGNSQTPVALDFSGLGTQDTQDGSHLGFSEVLDFSGLGTQDTQDGSHSGFSEVPDFSITTHPGSGLGQYNHADSFYSTQNCPDRNPDFPEKPATPDLSDRTCGQCEKQFKFPRDLT
jgi:hypothetical protein